MTLVALTQPTFTAAHGEIREGLDVRWRQFLGTCGFAALPLPNDAAMVRVLIGRARPAGVIMTGGGDLVACGGTDIGREATERVVLDLSLTGGLPVFGVCRGMQALLHLTGVSLSAVHGHVGTRHPISDGGREVNSFHRFGALDVTEQWRVTARAGEVVEAVEHRQAPISAVMWHPERENPPNGDDVLAFRHRFGGLR